MGSTSADAGRPFGQYVLLRRIAIGGMAEIFEARGAGDEDSERLVIKVLLPQLAQDPEFIRMLSDEARLQGSLDHPNLIKVLAFGEVAGQAYVAMERVDGFALSELEESAARQARRFPVPLALFVVRELLLALAYVHEAVDASGKPLGIVHRDVTPQNVLVSRDGRVRLGDFGIARSSLRDQRTRTGVIKGKLAYLSPEQATGSSLDHRADLYGAGLILFELLTGERWIGGTSEIETLREAEAPRVRRPSSIAPVDPRLDDVVLRALARFPEERYPSARAFLEALDEGPFAVRAGGEPSLLSTFLREVPTPRDQVGADLGRAPPSDGAPAPQVQTRAVSPAARRSSLVRPVSFAMLPFALAAVIWAVMAGRPATEPGRHSPATRSQRAVAVRPGPPPRASEPIAAASGPTRPLPVGLPVAPPLLPSPRVARPRPHRLLSEPIDAPIPAPIPAPTAVDDAAAAPLRRQAEDRWSHLRASLRTRGILPADLPAEERASYTAVQRLVDAGQGTAALEALGPLEARVERILVDGAFVRRKLDRVSALIRRSPGRADAGRLADLSSTALQELMDGRYDATNRHLNEILGLLAQSP